MPCVQVTDVPRFGWRGVMLDVARHFQPVSFLRRFVDLLALHKLNVLHLHLTDDQGWRMPVAAYPRLTEVGAWRRESPLGHYRDGRQDGVPHGGFYTKADLAEIVAYAARRFVLCLREYMLASARPITSSGRSTSLRIVIPAEAPIDKSSPA